MAYTLENETLQLVVDPEQGASILALNVRCSGRWLELMPDVRSTGCDLRFASFLMVPYSNRIEAGRFTFQGTEYQLDRGHEHAIHGHVRSRPWRVTANQGTCLECALETRDHGDIDWPWAFAVTAAYELEGDMVRSRLILRNTSDRPMPAGMGWHPFFSRSLTQVGEAVHLCFRVEGVYPDSRNNRIPSGPPATPTPAQDFRQPGPLTPDNVLDICCSGYDGGGYIAWPQTGITARFACSPSCSHLVLYNPAGKPYFAVEPVTNANDGVNLLAAGRPDAGTVVLEPDATLEATFDLTVNC